MIAWSKWYRGWKVFPQLSMTSSMHRLYLIAGKKANHSCWNIPSNKSFHILIYVQRLVQVALFQFTPTLYLLCTPSREMKMKSQIFVCSICIRALCHGVWSRWAMQLRIEYKIAAEIWRTYAMRLKVASLSGSNPHLRNCDVQQSLNAIEKCAWHSQFAICNEINLAAG